MAFKNTEAGFERCIAWLESIAESEDDVFIGMEATGHYWMACFAYLVAAATGYASSIPCRCAPCASSRASAG